MPSHAITSLTLENFRNYTALSLRLGEAPVVLRGENGAGKTNILEAISLLAPGRGLRGAKLREMDRSGIGNQESGIREATQVELTDAIESSSVGYIAQRTSPPGVSAKARRATAEGGSRRGADSSTEPNSAPTQPSPSGGGLLALSRSVAEPSVTESRPWVVAAKITTRDETHHIGTGRDEQSRADKRIIHINGERVRGHATLSAHACIQWLTPSQDQIFIEGGSARRKFFDRLVYGFAPEHAARVTAYENAMRERNTLLAEERGRADPYWLSVLEQQMAEHAVAITLARQEMLSRLSRELREDIAGFPRAELYLSGTLESLLAEGKSALDAESIFAERLKNERPIDAARRRAGIGPHRSEWTVIHGEKQREAAQCSTGEQKALLLSITLAAARARAHWCGVPPILLLDEVIAHLDESRRAQLFALIRESRIQAWMTGTDAADFRAIAPYATVLEVVGGAVM